MLTSGRPFALQIVTRASIAVIRRASSAGSKENQGTVIVILQLALANTPAYT